MSRPFSSGRWVVLMVALVGCEHVVCPSEQWCEGDTRVTCELVCSGGGTGKGGGLPNSCTKQLTRLDCAQFGQDTFGVPKTCQSFKSATNSVSACVDKPLTSCTLDADGTHQVRAAWLECGPGDSVRSCFGTDEQAFWNTEACFTPGHACLPLNQGVACVDAPRTACHPASFPRCQGTAVQSCVGTPARGYFTLTEECGTNPNFILSCAEADGGAACVAVANDAGP